MTINTFFKKRTIIIYLAIFIVSSVAFGGRVFSYNDNITHPSLTDNVAKVYNANFDKKLSEEEINWLKQGSIKEDLAPRWLNHFYNPENGTGLGSMMHSKAWSQSPNYQAVAAVFSGGNQTWQKAIDSYAKGNKKDAFYALGHVLHLLEDATVPAHTRIDEHAKGDPYEKWAADKIGTKISFDVAPNTINNLNSAFIDLAAYSSKNFLSQDTIKFDANIREEIIDKRIFLLVQDNFGNKYKFVEKIDIGKKSSYILSDSVHSDYFSLLAPKAISYGAGVVKLFFDEAEKAKQVQEQKSWWQKLREGVNDLLSGVSGSALYAGISAGETAPSISEAPELMSSPIITPALTPRPTAVLLPPDTVVAREKIVVALPSNTVAAEEKLGGNIAEESVPQDAKIPAAITEEALPGQAKMPVASSTPLAFLPGIGGVALSPTPTPTPSTGPDITPPQTTIVSQPPNSVASTTAVFIFTASESDSTFACQLDGAATSSCVSPKEYVNLSEASHNFKVSATDAAGNQDLTPAEHYWTADLTVPQLSNFTSAPGRTSALISWTASEAGIFQVEYGTSTSYGLTTATTSAVSLNLNSLTASTTYHWRLLAQDDLGNATSSAGDIFTTSSQAESVVISEIKTEGAGGANDEWIELYNPTSQAADISGWSIQYRGGGATAFNKKNFTATSSIPAYGFFLVVNSGYTGGVAADMAHSSFSLSAVGGNVFLVNDDILLTSATSSAIVDKISYGAGANLFPEATVFTLAPSASQSLERKAAATSTSADLVNGAHQWQGNGYDSNNNSQDFVLQDNPNPQNSLMLTEPRASAPGLMSDSAWPTWQGNLARSGQTAAVSLATSTLALKWIATTTAVQSFASRPALDSGGNIYVGRADGLAKYSPSGNLIWLYATDTIASMPLIASDGTIYFRGLNGLFAVSQGGQLKWKYALSGTASQYAAPAILSDGALIAQSAERVVAINQDATLRWSFDAGRSIINANSIGALVVDSADNIYVTIDNYIYALDKNGVKIWEKNYGTNYTSLSLGTDNTLYVAAASTVGGALQGGLYALNIADGAIKWSDINSFNDHAELAAAIDSSGRAYPIMLYGGAWVTAIKLQSYNASSTPSWMSALGSTNFAAPIITSDGKIYLADQNLLKVFDAATGNLDGSLDSGDNNFYYYFGAVGADGTIYTASNNAFGGTLYAIGSGG